MLPGLLLAAALRLPGQETVVTDPVLDGFELHRKGVYWWAYQGRCGGEMPSQSTIRFQPTAIGESYTQARSCLINQGPEHNVVRDDLEFYFFSQGQLHHKTVWDSTAAPSTPLSTYPDTPTLADQPSTPLELAGDDLYWGRYMPSVGWNILNRMKTDALRSPETVAAIVDGGAPVTRLKHVRHFDSVTGSMVDALVVLLRNGRLYRCNFTTGAGDLLATDIVDFAVHTRYVLLGNPLTSIYAAQGTLTPSATSAPGRLLRIDADTRASTAIYTATGHNQVIAVATDSDQLLSFGTGGGASAPRHLYLTEGVVGNCPSCIFVRGDIFSHALPFSGGPWTYLTVASDGSNLRSDDAYLYYRDAVPGAVSIKRLPAASGPYQLDYEADGLEMVQASQDLLNTVRLVKNHATFVRGYARVALSSTGGGPRYPTARLRGWNSDGVERPGSPLVPLNAPGLDATTSLDDRRAALNRSFLFLLPDSWVNGKITLRMEVNPFRLEGETSPTAGVDPYENNRITIFPGLSVTPKGDPTLVLMPIFTKAPFYLVDSPASAFWDILERARALLPVNQFRIYQSKKALAKPVVRTCWSVPPVCTSLEPFDFPDNQNAALFWLGIVDALSKDPAGASDDVHWVGTIHDATPGDFAGLARRPGRDLLVKMFRTGPTPWNTPLGGRVLAHELGHNYGRGHIDQWPICGTKRPDGPYDEYPYNPCNLGPLSGPTAVYGFDPISRSVIRPTDAGELMSYSPTRWTSKYTWDALFGVAGGVGAGAAAGGDFDPAFGPAQAVGGANAVQPTPPVLLISGSYRASDNRVELLPFHALPAGAADAAKVFHSFAEAAQLNPNQSLRVRLLDLLGNVIVDSPLVIAGHADAEGDELMGFHQFLPLDPAGRLLQIVSGPLVLAERIASRGTPVLVFQPVTRDALGREFDLRWAASDPDNDPLFFTVQYSADDGATWTALTTGYPWQEYRVTSEDLPGSGAGRFRVLATDGFHTAIATSEPLEIPRHTPRLRIEGVRAGERVPFGEPVRLTALALDPEDGTLPSDRLFWNVNGPTPFPNGNKPELLTDLPPGRYQASVLAFDSDQAAGQAARSWEVLPPLIPEAPAQGSLALDGLPNDDAYGNALIIRIPLPGGQVARAQLLHMAGALQLCLADLPLATNSQMPPSVAVRIDVNAAREPFASQDDSGFVISADGLPWEEAGMGQGMMVLAQARQGFHAVVHRGESTWSAEFTIADSLLGGWNHDVGLMIDLGAGQWPPGADAARPETWAPARFAQTPPALANRPPIAEAGPSQQVFSDGNLEVHLDGSGSGDPDGDALAYAWDQISGPTVGLRNANSPTPAFLAPAVAAETQLRFRLTVTDPSGDSATSETETVLGPVSRPVLVPPEATHPTPVTLVNGRAILRLPGTPGSRQLIEASSDLEHWELVGVRTADFYGSVDWVTPDPTNQPVRFYRTLPALNDGFQNRLPLSGGASLSLSLNRGATREPGEPPHAGNSGGASLWWMWIAPKDGPVTISTAGSDFDTLLAVYQGEDLRALQAVAADDDTGGNATSLVTFVARAGMTYPIAVDGFNGATGRVRLTIDQP